MWSGWELRPQPGVSREHRDALNRPCRAPGLGILEKDGAWLLGTSPRFPPSLVGKTDRQRRSGDRGSCREEWRAQAHGRPILASGACSVSGFLRLLAPLCSPWLADQTQG